MPVNNVNNINIMNINMNKNLVNNFFDGKIKNISFENNKINKFNFNRNIKNNKINIKLNINRGQSKDNKNIQSANNQKPPSIPTQQKFILLNKTNANGLANIGATCYMNATLQCLAHIQKLTYHFLNSDTKKKLYLNKVKYRLSLAYVTVLENLWQNNKEKYYSPNGFKDVISAMNPLFAGIQANDSKDLILFILETMHKELNIEKDDNKKILDNDIDSPNAQYNYDITFKKFSIFFRNSFNSVISNLFYGMFNSMMNCQNCHIIIYNVQCFNILIFPLQEVKKYKMKYIDIVDIYECFDYYQRPDYMGGKSFYCNNCRQMVDNINTTKILYGPRILVINLNRGKGLEFDIKLNFPEYIDISNYVYYKDKSPTYYELIGIVTHFGPSSMSGHFIAFCKSFGNQQWYKYNDAMVDLSNFEEAKNTGVPYILFYSYIKR
jgi:ubiquitin C-terminal hydrolase